MRIIASIAICLGFIFLPPCDAQTQETVRLSLASCEGYYIGESSFDYHVVAEVPERFLKDSSREPVDFFVLIQNTSDHPIWIYRQWNSWGYSAVHFVVEGADGKQVLLWKTGRTGWSKNYPDCFKLPSGMTHAVPISLSSKEEKWQVVRRQFGEFITSPPPPLGKGVRIKAVFEQGQLEEMFSKGKDTIWNNVQIFTNKVESNFEAWEDLIGRRNR